MSCSDYYGNAAQLELEREIRLQDELPLELRDQVVDLFKALSRAGCC